MLVDPSNAFSNPESVTSDPPFLPFLRELGVEILDQHDRANWHFRQVTIRLWSLKSFPVRSSTYSGS